MTTEKRLELAKKSLLGTSIGDAFGESFFGETDLILKHIQERKIPKTTWEFTDDTVMAIAVFEQLRWFQKINQDELAKLFSRNHEKDVNRGYGATARRILREIGEGGNWKEISQNVFEGMGSMGNGASMRVSSIGAYFFDDLEKVKSEAIKSAEITHSNIEGITGAIAVSVATALATRIKLNQESISPIEFIEKIIAELPDTDTTSKIRKGIKIPYTYTIDTVKSILGNGTKIIAQDTVPFSIWCAAHNLNNFEESLWKAVSILGDRDTICAIVGGITILSSEEKNIPQLWVNSVEKYEKSIFYKD
ncbi:ADP-ribosylglycohydrolase family protein [Aureivirga marina]|uniref:ADP-ribosylglycohydrolase family protein n=1 Tax=Aureivirga marina TaxID=1182451 RepID=UPI0018CB2D9E|nr:ADP-ribosylglycohydrolase family protein [Aureivirga marina]